MKKTFLLVSLVCIITSCSVGYIVNYYEQTNFPDGRDLYVSKCNSCHQLYNPVTYSSPEWDSIIVSMKEKAKLSSEQKNEIYNWIIEQKEKK